MHTWPVLFCFLFLSSPSLVIVLPTYLYSSTCRTVPLSRVIRIVLTADKKLGIVLFSVELYSRYFVTRCLYTIFYVFFPVCDCRLPNDACLFSVRVSTNPYSYLLSYSVDDIFVYKDQTNMTIVNTVSLLNFYSAVFIIRYSYLMIVRSCRFQYFALDAFYVVKRFF